MHDHRTLETNPRSNPTLKTRPQASATSSGGACLYYTTCSRCMEEVRQVPRVKLSLSNPSSVLPCLIYPRTKSKVPRPTHRTMPTQALSVCAIAQTVSSTIDRNSSSISAHPPSNYSFFPSARALRTPWPRSRTLHFVETRLNTTCIRFLAHTFTIRQRSSLGFTWPDDDRPLPNTPPKW
jgi:hypothetical protein